MTSIRRLRRRDEGQTIVEFALSLTLFLMILLGTAELGILVFRYNVISDLAQEGARRASVCGKYSGLSSTECNISTYLQARAVGITPLSVNVTWSAGSAANSLAGDTVLVQVQHTFGRLTQIIPLAPTLTLGASSQMTVAR
jgi:Flp pilus assembly protein TadG